jgi:hypothetical protein
MHFRQAITTKYLGPTNLRGSRIRAKAEAGSIVVAWDHALDIQENHAHAAEAFARKMGWAGRWVGGGHETGYTFVNDAGPDTAFRVRAKRGSK